ncbi:DUF452 family protein [Carboxylicivirga sp. RSCT41]|uniref:DUF452 family protein n=1 Tax=Carboxylicivirga agarovorans TaxID=3417570 RepID=UPI003D352CC2
MKCKWLHRNNSQQLLLFFNGWSCDEHPFKFLKSEEHDVLMLNDYRDLRLPEEALKAINGYEKVAVVAWSFGVWVAQVSLFPLKEKLCTALAINGTTRPVDKNFGIPAPIAMGTLSGLNEKNLAKFQRRMFSDKYAWQQFADNKPQREFEEVKNELFLLLQHFKVEKLNGEFYKQAIVGSNDMIFPTTNQLRFWEQDAKVHELESGHFCFYSFNSWDEIINLAKSQC